MINNKQLKGHQVSAVLSFPFLDAGYGALAGLITTQNGCLERRETR